MTILRMADKTVLGTLMSMLLLFGTTRSNAADFVLVPEKSTVALSGSALGGVELKEQGPGSLIGHFQGVIRADVTAGTVTFLGSSAIVAQTNGSWQPLASGESGSAPANYGAQVSSFLGSAKAAVRNLQMDVTSGPITLNETNFDSSSLVFSFITNAAGTVGYSFSSLLGQSKGSEALAGYATNNVTTMASLVTTGDVQTLTIPVKADFFFTLLTTNDTKLTVSGQFVATRNVGGSTPATYEDWTAVHFAGVTDPAIIGPSADSENDGFPNFVEFALGLDPQVSNAGFRAVSAAPAAAAEGKLQLAYSRPKGLSGTAVNYVFRSSPGMDPAAGVEQVVDSGGGMETVTFELPIEATAGARLFVLTVSP